MSIAAHISTNHLVPESSTPNTITSSASKSFTNDKTDETEKIENFSAVESTLTKALVPLGQLSPSPSSSSSSSTSLCVGTPRSIAAKSIKRTLSGFWSLNSLPASSAHSPSVPVVASSPSRSRALYFSPSTPQQIISSPRKSSLTVFNQLSQTSISMHTDCAVPYSTARRTAPPPPGLRVEIPSFSSSPRLVDQEKEQEKQPIHKRARVSIAGAHPTLQYKVLSLLKDTLQGKIVHARRVQTGQEVVMKVCKSYLVASKRSFYGETMIEDVENEINVLHRVQTHVNVVSISEVLRSNNHVWIVLEYAPHGDFLDVLQRESLCQCRVQRYARGLIAAVRHIHSKMICHLDISVENILLGADDELKLTDFGLAHTFDEHSGAPTVPELANDAKPGKPAFMAPEIYACERPFDARKADMFSVGVVLFVLVFRRMPYRRPSVDDRDFRSLYGGNIDAIRSAVKRKCKNYMPPENNVEIFLQLLSRLLCPPDRRLSAEEISGDTWLTEAFVCTNHDVTTSNKRDNVESTLADNHISSSPNVRDKSFKYK